MVNDQVVAIEDRLSDYDYHLPPELLAVHPPAKREDARLLVVHRKTGAFQHRGISDLPALLNAGDCLVLNDTKVLPAKLLGKRTATGGKWEGLYLGSTTGGKWRLIGQTRGRLMPGERLTILPAHAADSGRELLLELIEQVEDGSWIAQPAGTVKKHEPCEQLGTRKGGQAAHATRSQEALELLEQFGTVPLPPYLNRELATETDWARYQTTFARSPGAVAAPTAGLHFTPSLLSDCKQRGIGHTFVTLHVGIGTFRPVSVENLSDHRMHAEWCELPAATAQKIHETKQNGGRIVAVGTTSVRTLESVAGTGDIREWRGETDLFIRRSYGFRTVNCLLTNFHLPKSTLLVLVSAFAGTELIREAYQHAIEEKYRFYSYGDAMLIL